MNKLEFKCDCGAKISKINKYCPSCGTKLDWNKIQGDIVCRMCGEKLPKNVSYCPNCGEKVSTSKDKSPWDNSDKAVAESLEKYKSFNELVTSFRIGTFLVFAGLSYWVSGIHNSRLSNAISSLSTEDILFKETFKIDFAYGAGLVWGIILDTAVIVGLIIYDYFDDNSISRIGVALLALGFLLVLLNAVRFYIYSSIHKKFLDIASSRS